MGHGAPVRPRCATVSLPQSVADGRRLVPGHKRPPGSRERSAQVSGLRRHLERRPESSVCGRRELARSGAGANVVAMRTVALLRVSTLDQDVAAQREQISRWVAAGGLDPAAIERAGLTFMAIDEDEARAIEACEAYLKRYYGAVRMDVKQILLVGAPGACAEKINRAFDNGLNTLIIGPALPDLKQLDLFASQVMPRLKLD